ncbi:MAG: M64 family metallopeptidase [Bacteroidales bacterium]|nr:M64 family metallopeptidase [Bacteroidales bacterium]MCL2738823.1 M64 family metallopeptidase [Bacteroidales bacterium]
MKKLFFMTTMAVLMVVATGCPPKMDALDGDGEWYALQTHTTGAGIDLVFMGDGYNAADIAGGKYERDLKTAIEGLFEIQPYKAYRSYFNIYIVKAVSAASGIGTRGWPRNTRFSTYHANDGSMNTNLELCVAYAHNAPIKNINETVVILVANSTQWGGITYMWESGAAVAICPANIYLKAVVQHEVGGHGFAKLADEYIDALTTITLPLSQIPYFHSIGWFVNVDITDNPAQVIWKDFLDIPKYSMVGFYEGAYYHSAGAWRPEDSSCMRHNVPYFNAPSRAEIVRRIKTLAGEPFTVEGFMSTDIIELPLMSAAARATFDELRSLPPLAPPVLMCAILDK